MSTIRESAMEYEPKQTKNIADLPKVNTELALETRKATDKEGKEFEYLVTIVDGEEYRVPQSVLKKLKSQLEEKPDTTEFKVKKSGEGLGTEYEVILL